MEPRLLPLIVATIFFPYCFTSSVSCDVSSKCNSAGNVCETLKEDPNVKRVSEWWREMEEEQKPLKCEVKQKKEMEQVVVVYTSMPILETFPCEPNQASIFSFTGDIKEHKLEGPGKFSIGKMGGDKTDGTCFRTGQMAGKNVTSILGNFVSGRPDGVVKLELTDGFVYVGRFAGGHRSGFYRFWDASGHLLEVGEMYGSKPKGFTWDVKGKGVLVRTPGFLLADNGEKGDSTVLVVTEDLVMAGEMSMNVLTRARYAQVTQVKKEEEGCMINVDFEMVEGKLFKFHFETKQLRYHGLEEPDPNPLCKYKDKNENIGKELKTYLESFISFKHDALWQLEASEEEMEEEDTLRLIHDVNRMEGHVYTCKILGSPDTFNFTAKTHGRDNGLNGIVSLLFNLTDTMPRIPMVDLRFRQLKGYMKNGLFMDTVDMVLEDRMHLTAKVKDNVMHGVAVKLGVKALLPIAKEYVQDYKSLLIPTGLGLLRYFASGQPRGAFFMGTVGGGYLYGEEDEGVKAYIYPDLETALVGKFEGKIMKAATKAKVSILKCDGSKISTLEFDSDPSDPVLFFSPPTNVSLGSGPEVSDAYEDKHVSVSPSPVAGEGVFAKLDLKKDQLACAYSGLVYRNAEEIEQYRKQFTMNVSLSDEERRAGSKYSIGVGEVARMEIPVYMDNDPNQWFPTRGHKVNCDFPGRRQNVLFNYFEHPRYGMIMGVFAIRDIKAGEELFAAYKYPKSHFPYDFPWYHEFEKQYLKEERLREEEEAAKAEKKRKKKKNKSNN